MWKLIGGNCNSTFCIFRIYNFVKNGSQINVLNYYPYDDYFSLASSI